MYMLDGQNPLGQAIRQGPNGGGTESGGVAGVIENILTAAGQFIRTVTGGGEGTSPAQQTQLPAQQQSGLALGTPTVLLILIIAILLLRK